MVGPTLPLYVPHEAFDQAVQQPRVPSAQVAGDAVFADLLEAAASRANEQIKSAQSAGEAFARGELDDIHGTMIAASKADIELRLAGNIKNKVVDAFYELWRMQA